MSTHPAPPAPYAVPILPQSAASAPQRAPASLAALLLVPAGAACGLGLGALALSWWPGGQAPVAPLPPLVPAAEAPVPVATAAPAWPAVFGAPPAPEPAPAPPPPADPAPPEPAPIPALDARLRGLALDEDGGWALVEVGGVVFLVRPGSALDDHHAIAEIRQEGVAVESRAGVTMLTFPDEDPAEPRAERARPSLPRAILRGDRDLFDMPMPQPPAGYVPGPGFSGPSNR